MASNDSEYQQPQGGGVNLGIAGSITKTFIHSPLTPLILFACLALGVLGLVFTPRQEDPQISVPMVDIFVQYPGASSSQVASLAVEPLQRMMSEIPGVKHVYSASERGRGMVTVQFIVGEQMEPSLVKLHDKLSSNKDKIPPGVIGPLVKPRGVDDVPVVTLTLWSHEVDDASLRLVALETLQRLNEVKDTSQGFITGGRSEQLRVEVLPERLKGFGISIGQVAQTIRAANTKRGIGNVETGGQRFSVYTGRFLRHAGDIEKLIVGVRNGSPVYVRDIATISEGPGEAQNIVQYFTGPAANTGDPKTNGASAVTIAIAKKTGTNGVSVADAILAKVELLKGRVIPDNINVAVTRNYGKTANDKVNELMMKMLAATGAVTILIYLFLGFRPTIVVAMVIPVIILITIFSALMLNYTIDRVSLFALIFSIGILVDDATVVVENIYRRWLLKGSVDTETTIDAVREVGNPTILATLTIIAALLPMGFVSGMMGPYMRPIPVLGSVAMMFSLFAAFIFTPWIAIRVRPSLAKLQKMQEGEHKLANRLDGFFRRLLTPMIDDPFKARLFRIGIWVVFLMSCVLFYTTDVTVKMLPLDNKPEFNIVVNMPDGTALPSTANVIQRLTEELLNKTPENKSVIPEITAIQTYAGTASPFNFNGLVRHYYLRDRAWEGDIQIQLLDKGDRDRSSHEIAVQARAMLTPLAKQLGARIQVVEMPPGPPVLQTMVAEIYGPDAATRRQVAKDITAIFEKAGNVVDVDNYLQDPHDIWIYQIDQQKAELKNVAVKDINDQLAMIMGGYKLGDAKIGHELEPRFIILQSPLSIRGQISRLTELPIRSRTGNMVPLGELGKFEASKQDPIIFHKDLRPIEYVTGEVAGRLAAPVYGMIEVNKLLAEYKTPDGVELSGTLLGPPDDGFKSGFEWTGEWTVTYETFRDMGLAFAAAMVLIYMLVVLEFGNFQLPGIIMAPIPLTLIGIIPGHWLLGAEFTATSMIGWIALAGIIVRNSILLVDFSKNAIQNGMDKREAVIQAVCTRTRPILITQLTVIAGSSSIITDPIFQGMAISLLFGATVATVLTLVVIPLACVRATNAYRTSSGDAVEQAPCEVTPEAMAALTDAGATMVAKPSLLARIGSVLTMGYYLLRMPVIMAGMAMRNMFGDDLVEKFKLPFYVLRAILILPWMFIRRSMENLFGRQATPAAAVAGGGAGSGSASGSSSIAASATASSTPAPASAGAATARRKSARSGPRKATPGTAKKTAAGTGRKARTRTAAKSQPAPARKSANRKRTNSNAPAKTATAKTATSGTSPKRKVAAKTTTADKKTSSVKPANRRKSAAKGVVAAAKTTRRGPVARNKGTTKHAGKTTSNNSGMKTTSPRKTNKTSDDLTQINGIGPGIQKKLKDLGITSFDKMAKLKMTDIDRIDSELNFKGRGRRDNWVGQAKTLVRNATKTKR